MYDCCTICRTERSCWMIVRCCSKTCRIAVLMNDGLDRVVVQRQVGKILCTILAGKCNRWKQPNLRFLLDKNNLPMSVRTTRRKIFNECNSLTGKCHSGELTTTNIIYQSPLFSYFSIYRQHRHFWKETNIRRCSYTYLIYNVVFILYII